MMNNEQQQQQQQQQQRGRSPSANHNHNDALLSPSSVSPSAYSQPAFNTPLPPTYTTSLAPSDTFNPQFASPFHQDTDFLDPQSTLLDYNPQFQTLDQQQPGLGQEAFLQPQSQGTINTSYSQSPYNQNNDALSPGSGSAMLGIPSPYSNSSDASAGFPNFDIDASNQALDPSLLYNNQSQLRQAFDPSSFSLDPMTAAHPHTPTPPHLLRAGSGTSQSPSPNASPAFGQSPLGVGRSRAESLDPASAAYPPQGYHGNDWSNGRAAFQGHRRSPSDTYSDISSHSAQASPYLGASDDFDASPMMNPQDPLLFPDALGLGQFTLSDSQIPRISPVPSPHHSPSLMPQQLRQQPLPEYTSLNNFGFPPEMVQQDGTNFDSFQTNASEPFPPLPMENNHFEFGQADIMSPPEINIDFAPPSRQPSFGPAAPGSQEDTLSPHDRSPSRNRTRAKSDSHASGPRRPASGVPGRGRSPSLQPIKVENDSLSPHAIRLPASRSPSPSSHASNGTNRSRASSASSAQQRDYLLELANGGNVHDPKRVQKHPANFQCHLCPKKFTRAYNLRSHLRTHTDERPFVCTVCGKAFARQHDRKRHEGLHTGEKKFVCKGLLSSGEQWGCGRRFARADALGRHFRSEAGRVCIRPLLDEEATERQRQWQEEQAQQQIQNAHGFVAPPPMTMQPHLHAIIPAALLQTYPELASFDWSGTNTTSMADEMDYSGRSSFDASSGGEWDGSSENEMGSFGGGEGGGGGGGGDGGQQMKGADGHGMDMGGVGINGNTGWSGHYLGDFEGR